MKKKIICLILATLMVLSIMPATAFAANVKCERPLQFEENIATELKKLNLFKGVSETDFALRKVPSRIEALVIMLRLMGKEAEILAGSFKHPFTDVPSWANNYVGYAYENGLTKGISASKFGTDNATDVQFLTFVLRAMGYSDSNGDFTWDNPYDLATKLGVLDCSVTTGSGFLRADCASISYNALEAKLKDNSGALADKLITDGVFTKAAYDTALKNVPDYAGMLKAFGLANVKWHEYPKNQAEHFDNFRLVYLAGGLQYTSDVNSYTWRLSHNNTRDENIVNVHLLSNIKNIDAYLLCRNGKYYLASSNYKDYLYTPQEMSRQLIASYEAAKEIVKMCMESGKINSTMTEKEQIKGLFSYSQSLGIKYDSVAQRDMKEWNQTGGPQRCDSAYASLVNKEAVCTGFAAGMSLICHVNGIDSHCILLKRNDGHTHVVTYFVLDGEEYVCDLTNDVQLEPLADYLSTQNWELDNGTYNYLKENYYDY